MIDRRSKYWNRTDDNETNRGVNSKLTGDQIKERAALHAERLAYGKPTIQDIADHWFTKYQIRMHYSSEKEWAWRNEALILETMNHMVETGKIALTLTDKSLMNTVSFSGNETGRLIRLLEQKLIHLLHKIDFDFDPLKRMNMTEEEFQALGPEDRKPVEKKIALLELRNKYCLKLLPDLSAMIKDHKKVLLDTIEVTKELYDDSRLKEAKLKKEIGEQVSRSLAQAQDGSEFNPLEVEINDSDRRKITVKK